MLDLEPIKKRLEAADKDKWELYDKENGKHAAPEGPNPCGIVEDYMMDYADAEFIVEAHNTDIPNLIAEVERLREEVEHLQAGYNLAYPPLDDSIKAKLVSGKITDLKITGLERNEP